MSKWVVTEEHYKRLNEIQKSEQDLLGKLSELNKERIQIYNGIVELPNAQESEQKNDADSEDRETQAESDLLKLRTLYEKSKQIHKDELDEIKEEYERSKQEALAQLTKKNQEEIEKLKKANEETVAKIKADLALQKQQEEEQERKRRRLAEKREKAKSATTEAPKAVVAVESTPAAPAVVEATPAAPVVAVVAVEATPAAPVVAVEPTPATASAPAAVVEPTPAPSQEDEDRKKKEEEVRIKREALEKMKEEAQKKRESRIQELERLKKEKEQLAERKVGGSMVVRPTTSRPSAFSIFENGGKSPEASPAASPADAPAPAADAAPAEVVNCFTCKEPIKGIQQIKACGNAYHRLCFKCSYNGCTKFIGATTFVPVDNKPYCRDHAPKPDAPAPVEGEKKVSPFAHLFNRGAATGAPAGSGSSPFADGVPAAKSSRSVIVRPSSAAARFGSAQEKCTVCAKTVYAIEKLVADEKIFHKSCFTCNQCNKVLKLGNYASLEGNYYCKPHFKQLFMSKGNYSEGFGKKKLTHEWSEKNNKEVTPVII